MKEIDKKERTVIAVQVENEVGVLGTTRDYSHDAQMLFEQTVPEILHGKQQTWKEQFGKDAEEAFMCYSYADYMGKLAESGKKIYPLPMFTNVWLKDGNKA